MMARARLEFAYEDEDDDVVVVCCPMCGSSQAVLLGTLGRLTWYRCRDCGTDYNDEDGYNG